MPSIARAVITSKRGTTRSCSRLCREHIAAHHPDMQRTDEQIRERVTADSYEAELVA